MLSKYFHHLSEFYRVNLLRRLIIGVLSGGIIFTLFLLITFIIDLILWDNPFNRTFLHDLPSIGLIIALIVAFEVFGLFSHHHINNGTIKTQTEENDTEISKPNQSETT